MANFTTIIGRVLTDPVMVTHKEKEKVRFEVVDQDNSLIFNCLSQYCNISIKNNLKPGQMVTVLGTEKLDEVGFTHVEVKECHYERAEKCQEV